MRQAAVITDAGTPGAHYGEPRALLADGRTMPMGWSAGKTFPVGTWGEAEYIRTGHASLWQFYPNRDDGLCGHPMRGGTCNMDAGHRGRHTTCAWECDGCGKRQRSQPAATHPEAGWYCFMCVKVNYEPDYTY